MTAAWMLFALVTGGALSAAAAAAEHAVAAAGPRRLPRRFVWLVAMAATMVWPTAAWLGASAWGAPSADAVDGTAYRLPVVAVPAGVGAAVRTVDVPLLALWVAASVLLLARLVLSALAVRRWRRAWPAAMVDGVRVRVAPDAGPAVVGLCPMEVVLPAWVLALDAPLRALVLRHEAEHRAARDPYLLLAAALATALVPWHPALWWQARRLRLAVEVDCDARVLRADPGPARYAGLLLAVAQRRASPAPRLAPALLGLLGLPGAPAPRSHLERRITAMQRPSSSALRLRQLAFAAAALAAVAAACAVESPDRSTGPRGAVPTVARRVTAPSPGGETFFEFQVEETVNSIPGGVTVRYPDALRTAGAGGQALSGRVDVQFVVDTTGRPLAGTVRVLRSTHPAFAEVVRAAVPEWRFRPARVGGRPVKQLVQLPIGFSPE